MGLSNPQERKQFAGRFLTLTTEEKSGAIFERVYSRNGVTIIVEPRPGFLRFTFGTNWKYGTPGPMIVSAYIEDGEEPLACAQRELLEEMGATASEWTHYMTSEWKGTVIKVQEFFLARGITQGTPNPESDEHITGHIDLSYAEVKEAALALKFGTNEGAFALLKYVLEHS